MSGARIGSLIGAVGGLVFIMINAGGLPGPATPAMRVLGIAGFAFVLWYAVIRPGDRSAPGPASAPNAMRVYWICVGAEVLAIPAGAVVINNVLDRPELTVCWVVLVVGAHFLPFTKAFGVPLFAWMGWSLIALAVVGGAVALAAGEQAAAWTGTLAGVVLVSFAAFGGRTREVEPAA